jgi:anion-transporting  ArsA/GET3 family ATPase
MSPKRLYIFTGKGGVGKTTLALSMAKYLKSRKRKVIYMSFEKSPHEALLKRLGITSHVLHLEESMKSYMLRKLHSKIIVNWILKFPFFKSLVAMVPGFHYLVYMGHIADRLNEDPKLTIVLDSPSSGHALTMFEACQNFKAIFQKGVLFEDIKKIIDFLYDSDGVEVDIVAWPGPMPITEGVELEEKTRELGLNNCLIIVNNAFSKVGELATKGKLPDFIESKMNQEREAIKEFSQKIGPILPHINSLDYTDIVIKLSKEIGTLLLDPVTNKKTIAHETQKI